MPQRSNEFQRLIALLENLLVPKGWQVTESKMVPDLSGDLTEIDIAVEGQVGGIPQLIAFECRGGRKRKATKEWIREVSGKYDAVKHTGLVPGVIVVAVSETGFTRSAIQTAKSLNILPLTIEDALKANWPAILAGLTFTTVVQVVPHVLNLSLSLTEHSEEDLGLLQQRQEIGSVQLLSHEGVPYGTIDAVAKSMLNWKEVATALVGVTRTETEAGTAVNIVCQYEPGFYSVRSSSKIPDKEVSLVECILKPGSYLLSATGQKYPVDGIRVEVVVREFTTRIPLVKGLYADNAVAHGSAQTPAGQIQLAWVKPQSEGLRFGAWVDKDRISTTISPELTVEYTDPVTGEKGVKTFTSDIQ
jgi:hypothetical protein